MDYIEVKLAHAGDKEIVSDVLSATLAEIGYESFVQTDTGILAYVQESVFSEQSLSEVINHFPMEVEISYTFQKIEGKNWNNEWEKNYFEPLVIDDQCIIQSTFHEVEADAKYKIYIDPKMAFGTGHHQTTELMIREILKTNLERKAVLDMGCGTAILAILASMRGAHSIMAIDIDKWAYDNAIENLHLNHTTNIEVQIGGAELLGTVKYDVIFANINRNILLEDIGKYASVLYRGGDLYMSGFYVEDIAAIKEECDKHELVYLHHADKDNWAVVRFGKA